MIINVTQEDIKNGICRNSSLCPVNLALARSFNIPAEDITTGPTVLFIGRPSLYKFDTPRIAREFINKFDELGIGEPFSFELELNE